MDLILIEDVQNLGGIGDQVKVKRGYGRNYLLPQKKAVIATAKDKKRLEHQKRVADFKLQKARIADEATLAQIKAAKVVITRRAGEQNKLYGSVSTADIAEALAATGLNVDRRKIRLPEAIKAIGTTKVTIRLRAGMEAEINVEVKADAESVAAAAEAAAEAAAAAAKAAAVTEESEAEPTVEA